MRDEVVSPGKVEPDESSDLILAPKNPQIIAGRNLVEVDQGLAYEPSVQRVAGYRPAGPHQLDPLGATADGGDHENDQKTEEEPLFIHIPDSAFIG